MGSLIQSIMSDKVDILLAPAVATQYLQYSERLKIFGFDFGYTKTIDFYEVNAVISRSRTGTLPVFAYFLCFPPEVWALIFASIFFLSMTSSITSRFIKLNMLYKLTMSTKYKQYNIRYAFKSFCILNLHAVSEMCVSVPRAIQRAS